MKRVFSILMGIAILISTLSACSTGSSNDLTDEVSANDNSVVVDAPLEEPNNTNTPNRIENSTEERIEDGMVHTAFTIDFFGETTGNPMDFSLDLPEGWTSDAAGIIDHTGNWIASAELHKVENPEHPFSDTDALYSNIISSKEFTVSGYSAKSYVIEPGSDSDAEVRLQYMYYLMVDDAYVLLFFSPAKQIDATEDDFDKIVSSFQIEDK